MIPNLERIEAGIISDIDFSFALSTLHSPLESFQKSLPRIAAIVENIPPNATLTDLGGFPVFCSVTPSRSIPSTLEISTSIPQLSPLLSDPELLL